MEWTQKKTQIPSTSFLQKKSAKKDMKTIYQIKQVYCE